MHSHIWISHWPRSHQVQELSQTFFMEAQTTVTVKLAYLHSVCNYSLSGGNGIIGNMTVL